MSCSGVCLGAQHETGTGGQMLCAVQLSCAQPTWSMVPQKGTIGHVHAIALPGIEAVPNRTKTSPPYPKPLLFHKGIKSSQKLCYLPFSKAPFLSAQRSNPTF